MGVTLRIDEQLVEKGEKYLSEIRAAVASQLGVYRDQSEHLPGELAFAIESGNAEDILKLKRMQGELPDRMAGTELKLTDIDIALGECRIDAARAALPEAEAAAAVTHQALDAAQKNHDESMRVVLTLRETMRRNKHEQESVLARRHADLQSEMAQRARVAAASQGVKVA